MSKELTPFTHEYYEAIVAKQIEQLIVGHHFTQEQVERIIKLLRMAQRVDKSKSSRQQVGTEG